MTPAPNRAQKRREAAPSPAASSVSKQLLDPETLKACFQLPARDYDEPDISYEQKRQLEALGATNIHAVDGLGRDQAAYLIKFRAALIQSERQREHVPKPTPMVRWWVFALPFALFGAIVFLASVNQKAETQRQLHESTTEISASAPSTAAIRKADPQESARDTAAEFISTNTFPALSPTPASVMDNSAKILRDQQRIEWIKHGLPPIVKDSQMRALAKYPALSRPGSDLSNAFIEFYRDCWSRHDSILYLSTWPEIIADECEGQLHPTPSPEIVVAPDSGATDLNSATTSASNPYYPSDRGGSTYVNGYTRKDGTYVNGYTRSSGGHGHR